MLPSVIIGDFENSQRKTHIIFSDNTLTHNYSAMNLYSLCLFLASYIFLTSVFVTSGFSQTQQISFEDPAWDFTHAVESRVETHKGRVSLYLEGKAFFDKTRFSDGIIEVDVTTTLPRAFAGMLFRIQSSAEYEEAYVRLHKSGSPDAVQYTPVFNDVAAWQLYGPDDGWGMAAFDRYEWIPLRIEFSRNQIRVFAGQSNEAIVSTHLRRDVESGGLGLWGLFGAYFSNFRYTPSDTSDMRFTSPNPEPGVITNWALSQAFRADDVNLAEAPAEGYTDWLEVKSESTGLVNLSRYLPDEDFRNMPDDGDFDAGQSALGAYAKSVITSESNQIKKLHFGYSDNVVILLNGKPVYSGNSGFRSRDPLFQGMIGYHDAVFLDLKEGENKLVFTVTETFGGWGLMAKFDNLSGIRF
jgi:hypothetical protein